MKAILKFLDGKKTYIGVTGLALVTSLEQQGVLPEGTAAGLLVAFKALTAIGVAHKLDKVGKGVAVGRDAQ